MTKLGLEHMSDRTRTPKLLSTMPRFRDTGPLQWSVTLELFQVHHQ